MEVREMSQQDCGTNARRGTGLSRFFRLLVLCTAAIASCTAWAQSNSYQQTNIISDGSVSAPVTDATLINPWGVAIGVQTPFWINDAGSGLSAVYNASGSKQFTVTIPPKAGATQSKPSGIVYNSSSSDFMLSDGAAATFVFVTLDGTISGWNANTTNALLVADNSTAGATYTGVTIGTGNGESLLFAANFSQMRVDVFDSQFKPTTVPGGFTDPNLPAGFGPFGIHNLGGNIFVTYAQVPSTPGPAVPGAGLGYVDEFDSSGTLITQVATGGTLNAPWGVTLAPSSFGAFGGDLLVGNFGDGAITAFDPSSFAVKGQLQDTSGNVIKNSGLWEILFGAQGTGSPDTLYFAAGINDEKGGLFGSIAPQASAAQGDFSLALASSSLTVNTGQSATLNLTLNAMSGFDGAVALSCSGLPSGTTCSLAPSSVTLSGMTASSTLTVSVASSAGTGGNPYVAGMGGSKLTLAAGIFAPALLGLLFLSRRRQRRFFFASLAALVLGAGILGCGGSGHSSTSGATQTTSGGTTMASSYQMTITGTSGSLSHSAQVVVTIN
jgi:uncharacterized protein (TIGR03118 family)